MVDTLTAYLKNKEAQAKGNPHNYLDWKKLLEIIKDKNPREVKIGLMDDEEWTMDTIISDHKFNFDADMYFVHSGWATPYAIIDGENVPLLTTEQQIEKISAYEGNLLKAIEGIEFKQDTKSVSIDLKLD